MKRIQCLSLIFALLVIGGFVPGNVAAQTSSEAVKPPASKVVFFAADGMRPDLMDKFVAEGAMPTYTDLISKGVKGDNGLVQAFPPNTGRLVHPRNRDLPIRARLNQQYLFPRRRQQFQQPHRGLFGWCSPGRYHRRSAGAGRQEGGFRRMVWGFPDSHPAQGSGG